MSESLGRILPKFCVEEASDISERLEALTMESESPLLLLPLPVEESLPVDEEELLVDRLPPSWWWWWAR